MKHTPLSVSYRRQMLDQSLSESCSRLRGMVVDLGGEWLKRRGAFRPPRRGDLRWMCVNLDPAVAPDVIADVAHTPLVGGCADAVLCTEVLEHVGQPQAVLSEAARLLKRQGRLILSLPFLYPIHADPYDYQRLTAYALEQLLRDAGFEAIDILPQGHYFMVLAEMVRGGVARLRPAWLRWAVALSLLPWLWLACNVDGRPWVASSPYLASYTAGYFITATRSG